MPVLCWNGISLVLLSMTFFYFPGPVFNFYFLFFPRCLPHPVSSPPSVWSPWFCCSITMHCGPAIPTHTCPLSFLPTSTLPPVFIIILFYLKKKKHSISNKKTEMMAATVLIVESGWKFLPTGDGRKIGPLATHPRRYCKGHNKPHTNSATVETFGRLQLKPQRQPLIRIAENIWGSCWQVWSVRWSLGFWAAEETCTRFDLLAIQVKRASGLQTNVWPSLAPKSWLLKMV